MKITTTVKETKEIEIQIPFFRKDGRFITDMYYALLDEKTFIIVFDSDVRTSVSIGNTSHNEKEIANAYQLMTPITEEEFLAAHKKALDRLSLEPKLIEK